MSPPLSGRRRRGGNGGEADGGDGCGGGGGLWQHTKHEAVSICMLGLRVCAQHVCSRANAHLNIELQLEKWRGVPPANEGRPPEGGGSREALLVPSYPRDGNIYWPSAVHPCTIMCAIALERSHCLSDPPAGHCSSPVAVVVAVAVAVAVWRWRWRWRWWWQ